MHDIIDYPALIDSAMRDVVKNAIAQAAESGLPGDHHFFISFMTHYPGVVISDALKTRFPDEMTIVVQHQYRDLNVTGEAFSVVLSFNNVPEKLVVPFAALTAFADPSVKFGLQFHAEMDEESEDDTPPPPKSKKKEDGAKMPTIEREKSDGSAEIITLDAFRKK